MKESADLSNEIKQKINNILNSETFRKPAELAEAYLNHKETFPLPLRSKIAIFSKRPSKTYNPDTPDLVKNELLKFWPEFWNGILKEMRGKIGNEILGELEKNYDKKNINRILETLIDFEFWIKDDRIVKIVNNKSKEGFLYFRKKHKNVINATAFLLKAGGLTDSEKDVIKGIQSRHEFHLERLKQFKKINVDPIKEALLNRSATPTLLTHSNPEEWIEEFYMQCSSNIILTKPAGRPKKIIFNGLVIVLCELLMQDGKQVKWIYGMTEKLLNHCFGLKGREALTFKKIDNILHGT